MSIKAFLYAAGLGAGIANADFMVYTEPPIPTSAIPSTANGEWTTSVYLNARLAWNDFTSSRGSSYQSSVTSVESEVRAFASSHANYSIPADVTNGDAATTFYSKPDWYDALPTGVKQFKEQQVSDQFSIIRSVIGDDTTSSAGGSGSGSPGAAMPTPKTGLGAGFGAMAAVAAGVFL